MPPLTQKVVAALIGQPKRDEDLRPLRQCGRRRRAVRTSRIGRSRGTEHLGRDIE